MKKCRVLVLITLLSLLVPTGCTTIGKPYRETVIPDTELETLANWMTGSFSSERQALSDPDYYDIRLKMVRIWPKRTDGIWLYIEQAVIGHEDKPYRQRVYHVTRLTDGLFQSQVFSIPDPLIYVGEWKKETPLESLSAEYLLERKGCAITLHKVSESLFEGSTTGKECESELRGATYATSEVTITASELYSWDRGFDESDHQVWGAEKGGYHFLKIGDLP